MKKSLLALSLLASFGTVAHAQSSVTLYGLIDAGFVMRNNQNATGGSTIAVDAGQLATSRWGIMGSETINSGLKANFQLEATLGNDAGTAGASAGGGFVSAGTSSNLFDRAATVGLSGDFGSVNLGRQNMLITVAIAAADPSNFAHAGTNPNVALGAMNIGAFFGGFGANGGGSALRQNNSIRYTTLLSDGKTGFGGSVMYGAGEKAGDNGASSYLGALGNWTDGSNNANIAWSRLKDTTGASSLTAFALTGKFVPSKEFVVRGSYTQNKIDGNVTIGGANANNRKLAITGIGLDYLATPEITLNGSYYNIKRSGDVSAKADHFIGILKYGFSKRTTAYISLTYAKAGSTNAADVALGLAVIGAGNNSATRLATGISHSF